MAFLDSNTLIYLLAAGLMGCVLGWLLRGSIARKRQKNLYAHITLLKKGLKQARRQARNTDPISASEEHAPFQGQFRMPPELRGQKDVNVDMLDDASDSLISVGENDHIDIIDAYIDDNKDESEYLLNVPPSAVMEDYRSRKGIEASALASSLMNEKPFDENGSSQSSNSDEAASGLDSELRFGGLDVADDEPDGPQNAAQYEESPCSEEDLTEDNIVVPFVIQKAAGGSGATEYQSANLLDDSPTEFGMRALASDATEQCRWSKEGQLNSVQQEFKIPVVFDDDLTVISTPKVVSHASRVNPLVSLVAVEHKRSNVDVSASFVDYELSDLGDIPASNLESLRDLGIESSQQLLMHCRTDNELLTFAKAHFIPQNQLRQWITRCDLLRIPGLGLTHSIDLLTVGVTGAAELIQLDIAELKFSLDDQEKSSKYGDEQLSIWQSRARTLMAEQIPSA